MKIDENTYVLILDKKLPYELLRKYIMVLWNYTDDAVRCKAHDAIFDYLNVNRWDEIGHKYFEAIDEIACEAFVCCGLSVTRNNECRGKCGTKLNMHRSLANLEEYLKNKNMVL